MALRIAKLSWIILGFTFTILCVLISYFCIDATIQAVRVWRRSRTISDLTVSKRNSITSEKFAQEYISLSDRRSSMNIMSGLLHYLPIGKEVKEKKGNIFIAVVTTGKYLSTRVVAINQTWGRNVGKNNQLYFFVGEDCNIHSQALSGLPIVKMKGIKDHVYPPQKKVFAVLKYIYNVYGEQYRWFIRADDDVYLRISNLQNMLYRLDWTEQLYIGRPGWGKEEDRERLKLLPHENYCMGGPGIIFSAPSLKFLTSYLDECLAGVRLYNEFHGEKEGWYNEDVELGRCVSRTQGVRCTNLPVDFDKWVKDGMVWQLLFE